MLNLALLVLTATCLQQVYASAIIHAFNNSAVKASDSVTGCIDDCSKHGKCEKVDGTDTCVCDDAWGGISCAYRRFDLPSDHALSVTIDKDECYYFTITNDNPPKANLTIIILGFTKDPTIKGPSFYVAYNYYPNATHYDFKNDSIIQKKKMTILHPKPGKWNVAVIGQDKTPLILTVQANLDDIHNGTESSLHDNLDSSRFKFICSNGDGRTGSYNHRVKLLKEDDWNQGGGVQPWDHWYIASTTETTPTTKKPASLLIAVAVEKGQTIPELAILCGGAVQLRQKDMKCFYEDSEELSSRFCIIDCTRIFWTTAEQPLFIEVSFGNGKLSNPYFIRYGNME